MPHDSVSDDFVPDMIFVGSGPVDTAQLTKWQGRTRFIAVDGGLNWLMAAGIQPESVLGDMDSADPGHVKTCRAAGIQVIGISDQNSTDLEKALAQYPVGNVIGFGFLDGRLDHSFAALHALVRAGGIKRTLLIGAHDALVICSGATHFSLAKDARISIWPIGQVRFTQSTGLVWALDQLEMAVGVQTGTSNRALGGKISILPDTETSGAYAVIVSASDWQALYDVLAC